MMNIQNYRPSEIFISSDTPSTSVKILESNLPTTTNSQKQILEFSKSESIVDELVGLS